MIRYVLLPLACAALVACDDAAPPPPTAPTGQESVAVARPTHQPTGESYIVSTNEPFWQARVGSDAIVLTGVGSAGRRFVIAHAENANGARRFTARDGSDVLIVTVARGPCEDDMSGARFPLSGTLSIAGNGPIRGCARPASMPPPRPPEEIAVIPVAYLGRWAPDRAACETPARSIEGLTIAPRELRFHESIGVPTTVESLGSDEIRIVSAYEGEGQRWTRAQKLSLSEGGTRLVIEDRGRRFARIRCL